MDRWPECNRQRPTEIRTRFASASETDQKNGRAPFFTATVVVVVASFARCSFRLAQHLSCSCVRILCLKFFFFCMSRTIACTEPHIIHTYTHSLCLYIASISISLSLYCTRSLVLCLGTFRLWVFRRRKNIPNVFSFSRAWEFIAFSCGSCMTRAISSTEKRKRNNQIFIIHNFGGDICLFVWVSVGSSESEKKSGWKSISFLFSWFFRGLISKKSKITKFVRFSFLGWKKKENRKNGDFCEYSIVEWCCVVGGFSLGRQQCELMKCPLTKTVIRWFSVWQPSKLQNLKIEKKIKYIIRCVQCACLWKRSENPIKPGKQANLFTSVAFPFQ